MEKDRFPLQDAPNKNTDRAFVKLNRDGRPLLPDPRGPKQQDRKPEQKLKPKDSGEKNK